MPLVNLKYFASVREAIGTPGERRSTAATNLGELRRELIALGHPYAESLGGRSVRMALDQVMSDESALLVDGCEVAFFPPVTGG
ncbi:MAG: MoaD/ThiS family protein [Pseudomonadota bacterium]